MMGQSELVGVKTAPERKLDSLALVHPEIAPYLVMAQPVATPIPKRTGLFGFSNAGKYKDQRSYNIVIDSIIRISQRAKPAGRQ